MGPKMQKSKGGTQGRGVKMKAPLPAVTSLPDKGPPQKPFAGKVFYLDITSKLAAEKLEKDIKELGGTVEGFLSKEISYLITSKKEAKCAKSLKYTCSIPSPEPARTQASGSARPNGRKGESQEEGSSKKPEKDDVSRGKSLLKKVMKETKILQKNSILANAYNWGVRILHVEEAKIYIEQKKRSLQPLKQPESAAKPVVKRPARRRVKAQKLLSPFIKVEDSSGQYRPLYLVLPFFRSFQPPASKPAHSIDKKAVATAKGPEAKQSLNKTWHGQEGVNNSHVKVREEKKHGYCECCLQKYDDLEAHLLSQQHKNYGQGPHYQDVDNLISSFDFDFVDWSQFRQGAKSSDLLMFSGKQDEEPYPINDPIPQKLPSDIIIESTVVKQTECDTSHGVTVPFVNNTICCELISPGLDPLGPSTCVTDPSLKPPAEQVVVPNNDTIVSPMQNDEAEAVFTVYNKDNIQESMDTQEHNTQRLPALDPFKAANEIQNCVTEPVNGLPLKRIKLDESLCLPPLCPSQDLCNKETCALQQCEPNPNQSPSSWLHQPVREAQTPERRPRTEEEKPPAPKCKISVPLELYEWSLATETLFPLFESSERQSEFYGFSSHSMDISDAMESPDEPPSDHGESDCLFPDTSSASTFNGF